MPKNLFDRHSYCMYNNNMELTYDLSKNEANIRNHGISLADAVLLNWDLLVSGIDNRFDYGEIRIIGYAPIDNRLYCVVYTDRGNNRRVISLRKANKREVLRYEQ